MCLMKMLLTNKLVTESENSSVLDISSCGQNVSVKSRGSECPAMEVEGIESGALAGSVGEPSEFDCLSNGGDNRISLDFIQYEAWKQIHSDYKIDGVIRTDVRFLRPRFVVVAYQMW